MSFQPLINWKDGYTSDKPVVAQKHDNQNKQKRKRCQRRNVPKALSLETLLSSLSQSKSLGQTSTWSCMVKGLRYLHIRILTKSCHKFDKIMSKV